MTMKIKEEIKKYKLLVEEHLGKLLQRDDVPEELLKSIEYSLLAGGKRIRPILCLQSFLLFQEDLEQILDFACGIEMLHTYSLIHDDLPVMDDDDYRRGKLTNHKIFGEANALLAGDALFTWAFELMLQNREHLPQERVLLACLEMAKATGPAGMVGGQYLDMAMENKEISPEMLENIHALKTGKLIQASVSTGAILGGAQGNHLESLRDYGKNLGLLFQITDDLLDVRGDSEKTGKESKKDLQRGKATFPKIFGIAKAEDIAYLTKEKTKRNLSFLSQDCDFFTALADYIYTREA